MTDFTEDSISWFDDKSEIQRVIIEDGVKSIGNYAFINVLNI